MENLRKIIHGSSLRVVVLVAGAVVSFLLVPFLVHHLGDRTYGYWSLVGAILGYYGILDFGIVTAVEWHIAKAVGEKDPAAANRAISTSFFTFAGIGGVILLISIGVAALAGIFIHVPADVALFRKVVLITGFGFACSFPGRAFLGALSAHLRWDLISIINLSALTIRAAVILAVILAGGGLVGMASVSVAVDLLGILVYFIALRRIQPQFHLSFSLASFPMLKQIIPYSLNTFIIKINDQLRLYLDALVVSGFLGVGAVTHYVIGQRLSLTFREFMISLLGILAPWFGRLFGSKDFAAIGKVLEFGTRIAVTTATAIACLFILYGRQFIESWMGKNYLDAYWVLVFLATATFFEVSQFPSMSFLYGTSRHRFLARITLVEAALNVTLSLYLVRVIGLAGVALGTTIPCFAIRLFVQPVYVCRHAGLTLRRYYLGLFGRTMGVTALAVLLPWALVFRWVSQTKLAVVLGLMACQGLIAVCIAFVLALDPEQRAIVWLATSKMLRGEAVPAAPTSSRTVEATVAARASVPEPSGVFDGTES